jgi:hypothetical protein
MELEPILHVWKHTNRDLIDLTLTIETPAHDGKSASTESETIHTTSEHPFLTQNQGFTPAGKLKVGMRLMRADGSVGIVTGWKSLKATRVMYNLEVAQDRTFVVGDGQWVVHNRCDSGPLRRNILNGPAGAPPYAFQAQHILPCTLAPGGGRANSLYVQGVAGGFDPNSLRNGIPLPITDADSATFRLPRHFGVGNHPNYTNQVENLLEAVEATLDALYPGGIPPNVAADALGDLADFLNDRIVDEGMRLTAGGGPCSIEGIVL